MIVPSTITCCDLPVPQTRSFFIYHPITTPWIGAHELDLFAGIDSIVDSEGVGVRRAWRINGCQRPFVAENERCQESGSDHGRAQQWLSAKLPFSSSLLLASA